MPHTPIETRQIAAILDTIKIVYEYIDAYKPVPVGLIKELEDQVSRVRPNSPEPGKIEGKDMDDVADIRYDNAKHHAMWMVDDLEYARAFKLRGNNRMVESNIDKFDDDVYAFCENIEFAGKAFAARCLADKNPKAGTKTEDDPDVKHSQAWLALSEQARALMEQPSQKEEGSP
jgi:hypothetical protein